MRGPKIFLGLFLCLSNIIIIVPCVQVSGVRFPHTTDFGTLWKAFWQEVEASISAIMVFCYRISLAAWFERPDIVRENKTSLVLVPLEARVREENKNSNCNFKLRTPFFIPGTVLTGRRLFGATEIQG